MWVIAQSLCWILETNKILYQLFFNLKNTLNIFKKGGQHVNMLLHLMLGVIKDQWEWEAAEVGWSEEASWRSYLS